MIQGIQLTLKRGYIGLTENQKSNLRGLGLKKRDQIVILQDTAAIRGMIKKIIHLVDVARPGKLEPILNKSDYTVVKASASSSEAPSSKAKKTTTKVSKTSAVKKTTKKKGNE